MVRVRRQTAIGKVDASAIEELTVGDSDEHRSVPVLGDADGRPSPRSSSRHVSSLRGAPVRLGLFAHRVVQRASSR
jgi:hypothetical protein